MTNRRAFIGGLIGAVAAPAIIPYKSLMPVKLFTSDWQVEHWPLALFKEEGQPVPYDYIDHLLESYRLSKEKIAADFFNQCVW